MDIYHFSSPKPPILGRCKLLNCNKVAAALASLPTPSSMDGDRLILARIIRDDLKVWWSSKVSLVKRGFVTVKNTSDVGHRETNVLPFTVYYK